MTSSERGAFEAPDAVGLVPLTRYCRGLLRDAHLAEDVAQETLARLVAADPRPENPRAWAFACARRLCIDARRARAAAPLDTVTDDVPADVSRALSRIIRVERGTQVARALAELEPDYREALLLRYAEGLSRAEVAEVLGLELDQVRHRLAAGKRRLEAVLERLRVSRPGR